MVWARALVAAVAAAWGFLLVMDARVLVREDVVEAGRPFPEPFHADWGAAPSSSKALACTYFDGRALRRTVFGYSPSNFMGRDSCPMLAQR